MTQAHTLAPYFAAHFGPHNLSAMAAAASAANFSTPVMTSPVNNSGHGLNMSSGHLSSSGNSTSGNSSSGNSLLASTSSSSISPPEADMSKAEKMTRSHQYKKIMKPLLERKRRARINKCLDELKDIMTAALQAQGENVSKLEKADILELTVRHLQNATGKKTYEYLKKPIRGNTQVPSWLFFVCTRSCLIPSLNTRCRHYCRP